MEIEKIQAEYAKQLATISVHQPKIQELTEFAIKYRSLAEYLAKLIQFCAMKSDPIDLAPFYLIDSISKAAPEYRKYFAQFLPDIFPNSFSKGSKDIKKRLLMMFKVWEYLFPQEMIKAINIRVRLPEIEKLLLTQEDYIRLEQVTRSLLNQPQIPTNYMAPPMQNPYSRPQQIFSQANIPPPAPTNPFMMQNNLIPTTAPPPPPQPIYVPPRPNLPTSYPGPKIYTPPQNISQQMAARSAAELGILIRPDDGPYAIICKKMRSYADRVAYVPISLGNPASLHQKNETCWRTFYEDTPFSCKLCGVKHDRLPHLREHLDKHFLIAKTEKQPKTMIQRREPFQARDAWVTGTEREEYKEAQQIKLVPFQDALKNCYACHYPFEVIYSQEEKGWVFTNAFEVELDEQEDINSGNIVLMHKACLKGFMGNDKENIKKMDLDNNIREENKMMFN